MKTQELITIQAENVGGELSVKDFAELETKVNKTLNDFLDKHLLITDDLELKEVKEFRTKIRKSKNKLKLERDMAMSLVRKFNTQCMSLEKAIDSCDEKLKARVEEYTEKDKKKLITLSVKSYDMANLNAVKEYAEKLGLVCEIK